VAHRRTARGGLRLITAAALLATLVAAPGSAAAAGPARSGSKLDHTTAARVATVDPKRDGVPRTAVTRDGLGVPTVSGGGAAALRALRRPDATRPQRFDLPHWLPGQATGTTANTQAASRTSLGRTQPEAIGVEPTPAAPDPVGLRAEHGTFGLSDADDSLLYPDCSMFELCEEPPDPGVAVSATNLVQSVNELILIVDRETDAARVIPTFDFFALDNNQVAQSDPRVLYDASHRRWLATEISSDCDHGYLHVAVSSSDNPFGAWTVYRIVFPNLVVDFPGVGTSANTVVVSLNAFGPDPDSADCLAPGKFEGGTLAVIDWADLVATTPTLPVTTTAPESNHFTWRPAASTGEDPLARLVVAVDNGTDDTSDVGYATVSGSNATDDVTVSPVIDLTKEQGVAPFATPPQPRQPGDPKTIERAVDGEPTDAIAAGGHLWFIATAPCRPAGDAAQRDCVRLVELLTGASPSAVSVGSDTQFGERGKDVFMGGVGRAANGTIFVVYSRSSADDGISTYATWKGATESAYHAPVLIIPGAGTYSGARWGDYVILATDPAAPDAVWQGNQVPSVDGSWFTWLTQIRPAPVGPLAGSIRINGGDQFAGESVVDLQLTNPKNVAATVVRVANGPATTDGVLSGGLTLPIADDLPWSLDVDQPDDTAPDGPRTVYVQWGDGRGHWSAVASDLIVLDTTGPTIGAVRAPQVGTSTLTPTGGVPVDIHWVGGADALAGLEGYDVEVSRDDGDWEDFASVGGTSASGRVAAGHVYLWRVRAFDRLGNVSDWRESPPARISIVDDASTSLHYDAAWRPSTSKAAYKGTIHAASRAGATATLSFSGSSFALVGTVAPGRGVLDVFVDGRRVGRFTETGTATRPLRIGFRASVGAGRHLVRIVAADGRREDLDAVILLS
jgi:hypothetical protein